jgi:iron complex transport system substrate-binding protein
VAAPQARIARTGGTVAALLAVAVSVFGCRTGDEAPAARASSTPVAGRPTRIVSLIPATTEMIFAMGAGDRLVGVGSYDRYPPDAVERLPRVGGLIDPNTERIMTLTPDLVVVYDTQVELKQRLDRAGIPYFSYEHRTLADIMETLRGLGQRIGEAARADLLARDMEQSLDAVRASVAGLDRPRTMLVFGRETGSLRNVDASGGYGFLADVLDIAGATNLFGDIARQSVQPSTETILATQPDVIIELRYGASRPVLDVDEELAPWRTLASIPAVRNDRVYLLTGDEFVVPGPRIVLAAERLAATVHPERARPAAP